MESDDDGEIGDQPESQIVRPSILLPNNPLIPHYSNSQDEDSEGLEEEMATISEVAGNGAKCEVLAHEAKANTIAWFPKAVELFGVPKFNF